jgi:hypothetical protein
MRMRVDIKYHENPTILTTAHEETRAHLKS